MSGISVFDFKSAKAFIHAWISARPKKGRGEKAKIAEALGCHSGYVSQVLEKDAQFSAEQAVALAEYMSLGVPETRFLHLLLQRDRAGSKRLRDLLGAQIDEILQARTLLRNRMEKTRTLDAKDQHRYYSSWHYSATHMAISLPAYQSRDAVAQLLGISRGRAGEILEFLCEVGLAVEEGGAVRPGTASIYLPEHSPLISKHHTNWRLRAMQSMDAPARHDLHYSSVATLNAEDLPKVRAILVKAIEEVRAVIRASSGEDTVFAYDLDFFSLGDG